MLTIFEKLSNCDSEDKIWNIQKKMIIVYIKDIIIIRADIDIEKYEENV